MRVCMLAPLSLILIWVNSCRICSYYVNINEFLNWDIYPSAMRRMPSIAFMVIQCYIHWTFKRMTVCWDPRWHLYSPSSSYVRSRMIKSPVSLTIHILSFLVPRCMYSILSELYMCQNVTDSNRPTLTLETSMKQWSVIRPPISPGDYLCT